MWQYIVKRLLLMLPTLIGAALVVFLLMHVIPGDVALLIIGGDQGGDINPQELVKLRAQLGLNRPLYVQFLSWLWGVVHLNFGTSLWTGTSVLLDWYSGPRGNHDPPAPVARSGNCGHRRLYAHCHSLRHYRSHPARYLG